MATDRADLMKAALTGTDREWWDASDGYCGGCGRNTCHQSPCVDDEEGNCRLCPVREGTGQ